ncbi:MAG: hypothetical protein JXB32_25060 [Deltaproteobacteria bacterium]|nr:hypothetical protein [Deltaproteobacteria bacterium]
MQAWPCGVHDSVRLPLPAGGSLEQRISALFGDSMRRFRALAEASASATAGAP